VAQAAAEEVDPSRLRKTGAQGVFQGAKRGAKTLETPRSGGTSSRTSTQALSGSSGTCWK